MLPKIDGAGQKAERGPLIGVNQTLMMMLHLAYYVTLNIICYGMMNVIHQITLC